MMERVGDNEGRGKLLQYNNAFEKLVLTSMKLSAFLMLHNGKKMKQLSSCCSLCTKEKDSKRGGS